MARIEQLRIKAKTLAYEGKAIRERTQKLRDKARNTGMNPEDGRVHGELEARLRASSENYSEHDIKRIVRQAQGRYNRLCIDRQDLHEHRVNVVRPQARVTHLALAFFQGTPYHEAENNAIRPVDFDRVKKEVRRFSTRLQDLQDFDNWAASAKHYRGRQAIVRAIDYQEKLRKQEETKRIIAEVLQSNPEIAAVFETTEVNS